MSMEDLLAYFDMMENPAEYDPRTVLLYLESLAIVLAETDHVNPQDRTSENILSTIALRYRQRVAEDLANVPDLEELELLHSRVETTVQVYQHMILKERGFPLPTCLLQPPCPYHS